MALSRVRESWFSISYPFMLGETAVGGQTLESFCMRYVLNQNLRRIKRNGCGGEGGGKDGVGGGGGPQGGPPGGPQSEEPA